MAPSGRRGPAKARRKGASAAGRAAVASRSRIGRYTAPEHSGKYTPPIPRAVRRSPRWFGPAVLALLILGVLFILLNYLTVLPGGTSAWYLVVGLLVIFAGFVMATRYR